MVTQAGRVWTKWAARTMAGVCVVWWGLGLVSGRWFLADLLASYRAQLWLGFAAGCLLCAAMRRWRPTLIASVAVLLGGWGLGAGRPLTVPGVDLNSAPAPGNVRIASMNINPENAAWREDLETVFSWRPDVVVLIETSPQAWREIARRGMLDGSRWRYHAHRSWVDGLTSPCFILSRWPLERLGFPEIADADRDVLICRVGRPEGEFLIGAAHPHSPRTVERWQLGNEQVRTTGKAIGEVLERGAGPLIIGADLNSGPAGSRAGALRDYGLRMSKPMSGGWGSFPAGAPPVVRVQLDDVWRSRGVEAVAWSSPGGLGSDHRAVVVDVALER